MLLAGRARDAAACLTSAWVGTNAILVGTAGNVWDGGALEPVVGPAAGTRALLSSKARNAAACLARAWVGTNAVLVGLAGNV